MKITLKSLIALAMVICMLFAVAGCGDRGRETSSEQNVNEDFFATTETKDDVSSEDTSSNTSSDAQSNVTSNKDNASNKNQNTSSGGKTSSTTNTSSNGSGNITTKVPEGFQIGGKSWKDVLAGMPKKLRGTKLTMYNWNPATEYTGAPAVMDAFKKQTGIQVTWNTISYSTYFTKLPALIASGENIPDMARIGYADLDFIQNMQPISVSKYDFTDEAWDQTMMKNLTFGGKTYGTTLQNTHISGVYVMFYNKAIIDKYDYEDPYKLWKKGKWNWEKFIEMCEEAKDDGMSFGCVGEGHMPSYVSSYGITNLYYDGKKMTSKWNSSDWLKVHQKLGDLYNKDQILGRGREELFDAAGCPFYVGTTVHARNKNSYFGDLKANKTLYFVPIPEHKELKKYYQGYGEIEAYGIPKGAKNVEAVPYFLRYFLDGANYTLDTYFGNKQNLEVYNWCMNQPNKVLHYGYESPDVVGEGEITSIQNCTGAQVKKFIDSNKGVNEKFVKEQNEIIAKLK